MKYIISNGCSFGTGTVLGLTKPQAALRAHNLKPLGNGLFEALAEVQFKAGEEISYQGELPKHMAALVIGADSAEAKSNKAKKQKAKEEAEQKAKEEAEQKAKEEAEQKAKEE